MTSESIVTRLCLSMSEFDMDNEGRSFYFDIQGQRKVKGRSKEGHKKIKVSSKAGQRKIKGRSKEYQRKIKGRSKEG